jgi:signal transduction histidine kinase
LKFSSAEAPVSIAVFDADEDVVIEVTDKGIGIEESELSSVFESFQRGSNASEVQGTGLGLSIVKKAVGLMNGSIVVKSAVGKGSTFRVQIPMHEQAPVPALADPLFHSVLI